jgi:hypothetical protein
MQKGGGMFELAVLADRGRLAVTLGARAFDAECCDRTLCQ